MKIDRFGGVEWWVAVGTTFGNQNEEKQPAENPPAGNLPAENLPAGNLPAENLYTCADNQTDIAQQNFIKNWFAE